MYLRESKQVRADGRVVTYQQPAENVWNPDKACSQARIEVVTMAAGEGGVVDDEGRAEPARPGYPGRPTASSPTSPSTSCCCC